MPQQPYHRPIYNGKHKAISVAAKAETQGTIIKFTHEPTGHSVSFPMVINSFSDNHKADFELSYGNNLMDPRTILNSTDRAVQFTFKVLNASLDEARFNTQSVNMLIQMLYPQLNSSGGIAGNPYIRIGGINFFGNSLSSAGPLCVVEQIEYTFDMQEGVVNGSEGISSHNTSGKEIYPISMNIAINATVVIEADYERNVLFPDYYPNYR